MFGQAQEHFALSAGDPGCGVQPPIPEGLGFCAVQLGLVGEQVPAGQVPEAGVLAGPDPVLDPGVRVVALPGPPAARRSVWVVKAW